MKYHLYTTSRKAWSAMIKAIKQAKKSVYIEMYIFLDDMADKHDFISLLKTQALAGVEVVLVLDSFGSLEIKKQTIADLRQAGVEVLFFSHFWHRTHRKIILVDKRLAFVGGVNIEKKIINWHDVQIQLEGKKTVNAVLRSFAYTYQMCGGKNAHILAYYKKGLIKKIRSLVLESLPGHNMYSLLEYYKNKIITAKTSLKMVTPYFIPPRWLLALLDDARRRNIEIEIIIPADTDIKTLNKINYSYIFQTAAWGIKFYASPVMNHAKILIVDGQEALIGSQNMDIMSLGRNFEVGVFSRQKDMVKDLDKIFEKWKRRSTSFQVARIRLNWWDKIKVGAMRLFLSAI